ncbi:MAG: hypothetical protein WDM91_01860 [Rhizomicrobium sp.]
MPNRIRSRFVLDIAGTQGEHHASMREMAIMWFKDAAAGLSLVVFVASAYLLVPVAQTLLAAV